MAAPSKKSAGKTAAKHTRRTKAVATKTAPRLSAKPAAKSRPAKRKSGLAAVPPIVPTEQRAIADTTRRMVAAAAAACDEKKAEDTRILELDAVDAGFTDFFLLDYVDFVVHIFLAEKRAFYDIERLRKSARHVDALELQKALTKKTASTRKRVAAKTAAASHAVP
jgi:ribosomal silencing factor RsfS